jgi:hypothetical protein
LWRIDPRPDGRPAPDGPLVEVLEDRLGLIAAGHAIPIALGDSQNGTLRQDLTSVPIEEIELCQVVLAARAGERSRLATAFRESARTHLTGRDSESRSSDP